MVFRNPGSVLVVSRRSCATSKRKSFSSCDNSLGTNFAATRFMFKSSHKIACAESLLTPTSSAISRTVKRRSVITKFHTLSTLAALLAVWVLPQRCSLFADVQPSSNRLNHSLICVTPIASFPNTC
ncbi:hypothetical protein NPIL_260981 [Nephila pilipes]|uniref:Uncharacterized protein n=1 Tax=Nephila pilipes TaxID=299642 RepID=A0A8X6QAK9_NEPPI|nr:hypothetical protein NPIL_260981 [Nephila pilipes]